MGLVLEVGFRGYLISFSEVCSFAFRFGCFTGRGLLAVALAHDLVLLGAFCGVSHDFILVWLICSVLMG